MPTPDQTEAFNKAVRTANDNLKFIKTLSYGGFINKDVTFVNMLEATTNLTNAVLNLLDVVRPLIFKENKE